MTIRLKRIIGLVLLVAAYGVFIWVFSYCASILTEQTTPDGELTASFGLPDYQILKALTDPYKLFILSLNIPLVLFIYNGTLRVVERFLDWLGR